MQKQRTSIRLCENGDCDAYCGDRSIRIDSAGAAVWKVASQRVVQRNVFKQKGKGSEG
jgi:hypothetical protein